jgi:hypothetical protein
VSDPGTFWSAQLPLPEGTEPIVIAPSADGSRGVCLFRSDSVATVQEMVDGAAGAISVNEYHAIDAAKAHGLPA